MKTKLIIIAIMVGVFASSTSWAYEYVNGYIRSSGTYVSPYIRASKGSGGWSSAHDLMTNEKFAYVNVRGYLRNNGTYVSPHIRTNPDGFKWNNLSSFNEAQPVNEGFNPDANETVAHLV